MTQTLEAVYDGLVLKPDQPLEVEPNTRVRLILETLPEQDETSFLDTAMSLNLQGPPDWSCNLDKYLYGEQQDVSDA